MSFRTLIAFSPVVGAEIARANGNVSKIGTLLETARGDTRRSHASAVKDAIGNWHTFSPGLSRKKGAPWGWDHSECARLLCPPSIEWNEEQVVPPVIPLPAFLHFYRNEMKLRDPKGHAEFKLGAKNFPRFLWEGETMDKDDPTIGFLTHSILFAVRPLAVPPVQY